MTCMFDDVIPLHSPAGLGVFNRTTHRDACYVLPTKNCIYFRG